MNGSFLLLKHAFRKQLPVLKGSVAFMAIATATKAICYYIGLAFSNRVMHFFLMAILIAIEFYLWEMVLYTSMKIVNNQVTTFKTTLQHCLSRWREILLVGLIYLVITIGVIGISYLLIALAAHFWANSVTARIAALLFSAVLLLNLLGLTSFAMLLILDKRYTPVTAFMTSYQKAVANFRQLFILYIVAIVIYIMLDPNSLHAHFFARYHVLPLFDFMVIALLWPLMANLCQLVWEQLSPKKNP